MSSDQYQNLRRYLREGEPAFVPPLGEPVVIPPEVEWVGFGEVYYIEDWMRGRLGPTAAIRAAWIATEAIFDIWIAEDLPEPWPSFFDRVEHILEFVSDMPLGDRSQEQGLYLGRAAGYLNELDDITPQANENWPQGLHVAVRSLQNLLQAMISYNQASLNNTYYYAGIAVADSADSYSYMVNPAFRPEVRIREANIHFLEWWWKAIKRRIAEKHVSTDGPRFSTGAAALIPSQSRSLREFYEDAFKKWKDKKGFVLWDSVKGVFDSVFNTSDFRKLTDSLGLPVTHLPGVGKALRAVGSFTLSALWIAPKMAKAVVEETGLPPEKVEKVFAIAKGIDSLTPGPWGSGIIILYYTLATAGKAPSKAAVRKALAAKAKLIDRISESLEKERYPKMRLVSGGPKSSRRKDPLRDLTEELNNISKNKKVLKKSAQKTADLALEIGTWAAEFEDPDEPLDALGMAIIPAHERLVSQGDEYESENLLDMAMYLADQTLSALEESSGSLKMAAGPRLYYK